jgi:hypothetical protein
MRRLLVIGFSALLLGSAGGYVAAAQDLVPFTLAAESSIQERPLLAPKGRLQKQDLTRWGEQVLRVWLPGEFKVVPGYGTSELPCMGDGHALVTIQVPVDQIAVGDIVIFEDPLVGTLVAHQVVDIGEDDKGWWARTWGVNNRERDLLPVREDSVRGIAVAILYTDWPR